MFTVITAVQWNSLNRVPLTKRKSRRIAPRKLVCWTDIRTKKYWYKHVLSGTFGDARTWCENTFNARSLITLDNGSVMVIRCQYSCYMLFEKWSGNGKVPCESIPSLLYRTAHGPNAVHDAAVLESLHNSHDYQFLSSSCVPCYVGCKTSCLRCSAQYPVTLSCELWVMLHWSLSYVTSKNIITITCTNICIVTASKKQ